MSSPLKIVVSGAAGQIAYSLLPLICIGHVFGPNRRVSLRLLDIPMALEALEGVKMELQDCAFNLVDEITPTSDLEVAFKDADVAILVGGFPRKQGMQRKDLIEKNVTIFKAQGEAIEKFASRDVKVLVVANPANTNCLIAMENAPSIPRKNFSALTRLDHERLRSFLVERVNATAGAAEKITSKDVRKCIIWGNHSSTQVPDVTHADVHIGQSAKPLTTLVTDADWIENKLVKDVQERGAAIIKARKLSSAMSAAAAVGAHLRDWFNGTKDGEFVSMAISSDGNKYGVPDGLIYSFPVKCTGNGNYEVVDGLSVSPRIEAMMKATATELTEERADAQDILSRH
jgi:malate dehydrogenase